MKAYIKEQNDYTYALKFFIMYFPVFSIVVIFHVYMCISYSPVPSLQKFGEIYYTYDELKDLLAETWTEYGKQRLIYNNLNESIVKLYIESTEAQQKCILRLSKLRKECNETEKLVNLVKKETDLLNRTILQQFTGKKIDNSSQTTQTLKSVLLTEELISTTLNSKLQEIKIRQLIEEKKITTKNPIQGSEGPNIDEGYYYSKEYEYDQLYSSYLSMLEYNDYIQNEIKKLRKIKNELTSTLNKYKFKCEQDILKLVIEIGKYNEVEKYLMKNIEYLQALLNQLDNISYADNLALVAQLDKVKIKNNELKLQLSALTSQELLKSEANINTDYASKSFIEL